MGKLFCRLAIVAGRKHLTAGAGAATDNTDVLPRSLWLLNVETILPHLRATVACGLARPVAGLLKSAILVQSVNPMVFNSLPVASPVKSLCA
jgi:hypothetical protein